MKFKNIFHTMLRFIEFKYQKIIQTTQNNANCLITRGQRATGFSDSSNAHTPLSTALNAFPADVLVKNK